MAEFGTTEGLDAGTFEGFRRLILDASGISLREGKESLVAARIAKRMRSLGLERAREYLAHVEADASGTELVYLLDSIATNVTSFFRERDHFDLLAEIFRRWQAAGQRRFRFWSAACSTGEEPYTMALTLHQAQTSESLDIKILATDLSTKVLTRASQAIYPAQHVAPVPAEALRRYFDRQRGEDGGEFYTVRPALRSMVTFRRLNLAQPPFPMAGPLDAVFVRNVMIYFDREVRQNLIDEATRLLKPGGYLFCGHAESLAGLSTGLKTVRPSVYCKS